MSLLLNVMLNDPDPELGTAIQLTNTIRTLLDPENMLRSSTEKDGIRFEYIICICQLKSGLVLKKYRYDSYLIPFKAEFLGFFYRDGVIKLTNFLQNATTDTQIKNDDYRTAHTYVIIFYISHK